MLDDVSRKRRGTPSPAMIVAIIALVVALGGSAYAAKGELARNSVGSKQLKPSSVTTGKLANNSITGAKVAANSLTGADINLNALGTVPSAATATQTGNANTITGHAASCPGGTTLIRGICFDSASNSPADSVQEARDKCAAKGGYLPSPLKLYSAKGVLTLGTGVGSDRQYTDSFYDDTKTTELDPVNNPSTIVVDGLGTLTEQADDDNAEYICVYPLVR